MRVFPRPPLTAELRFSRCPRRGTDEGAKLPETSDPVKEKHANSGAGLPVRAPASSGHPTPLAGQLRIGAQAGRRVCPAYRAAHPSCALPAVRAA